ncbi:MAG TPA: hypothetical protein DDY12_09965 [Porphyromonadaceae bacterium]|nr:hypothetical protein [Porphyromonadaceae bacterium]
MWRRIVFGQTYAELLILLSLLLEHTLKCRYFLDKAILSKPSAIGWRLTSWVIGWHKFGLRLGIMQSQPFKF